MFRKLVKFTSVLCLCFITLFGSVQSIHAENLSTFNNVKNNVEDVLAQTYLYQQTTTRLSDFYLGEQIPAYEKVNNTLSLITDTAYYPLYNGNNIVGIAVSNPDGSLSIGEMFASELQKVIVNTSAYNLIFDGTDIYVVQGVGVHKIWGLEDSDNTVSLDIVSLVTTLNISDKAFTKTDLNENTIMTRDYGTTLNNFPFRPMSSGNDCWAACIAAAVSYKGTSITTGSVVSATANGGSATITQVSNYLTNIYHISNSSYTYALGFDSAMSHVGNYRPILAGCYKHAGGTGHMVAIKGVWYVTTAQNYDARYDIMDPYYDQDYINVFTNTSSSLTFKSCGNNTYTWYQTVVIQ